MRVDTHEMKKRMLLDDYPNIRSLGPPNVKRRVISRLLRDDVHPDSITRKEVQDIISRESTIWNAVKSLKRGHVIEAVEEARSLHDFIDFRDVADGFEEILLSQVEQCLSIGMFKQAKELIRFFGKGIDFTDMAKKAYDDCTRWGIDSCERIKEVFPDITFD